MTNRFPTAVEDLSPEWMTAALRGAGAIDSARVTDVIAEPIGEQGQTSVVVRVTLAYDSDTDDAPRSHSWHALRVCAGHDESVLCGLSGQPGPQTGVGGHLRHGFRFPIWAGLRHECNHAAHCIWRDGVHRVVRKIWAPLGTTR